MTKVSQIPSPKSKEPRHSTEPDSTRFPGSPSENPSLEGVRHGLPPAYLTLQSGPVAFREVRLSLGITQQDMHRAVGLSVRTISALETGGKKPTREDVRRYRELARLRQDLNEILMPEVIPQWLVSPNTVFEGSSPLDLIARGETDRVWRLIWQLQDGVPVL